MSIDRFVLAFAGFMILASLLLGLYVSPYWFWFTAFVGANLFQSAFTGFCPLAVILRKLGVQPAPRSESSGRRDMRRAGLALRASATIAVMAAVAGVPAVLHAQAEPPPAGSAAGPGGLATFQVAAEPSPTERFARRHGRGRQPGHGVRADGRAGRRRSTSMSTIACRRAR